ncbi:hypothetical protein [Pseudomonas phage LUZ7]|uniref:Uncharacterized protein n=1 Tax=Pseudomonas phage LUZ7 TaxID=655097 RepID=C8ZKA8_9CAUD|nr:hypothetical protein PP-LUZ7_gp009 [Pseudomonas phage LUZ7]CAZ66150.1 hypothetical protein [Pseudomonas phage LUZ7]
MNSDKRVVFRGGVVIGVFSEIPELVDGDVVYASIYFASIDRYAEYWSRYTQNQLISYEPTKDQSLAVMLLKE